MPRPDEVEIGTLPFIKGEWSAPHNTAALAPMQSFLVEHGLPEECVSEQLETSPAPRSSPACEKLARTDRQASAMDDGGLTPTKRKAPPVDSDGMHTKVGGPSGGGPGPERANISVANAFTSLFAPIDDGIQESEPEDVVVDSDLADNSLWYVSPTKTLAEAKNMVERTAKDNSQWEAEAKKEESYAFTGKLAANPTANWGQGATPATATAAAAKAKATPSRGSKFVLGGKRMQRQQQQQQQQPPPHNINNEGPLVPRRCSWARWPH